MSPKTIPKSMVKAALKPLVILVSNNTKKPGPIENAKSNPQGIAANISCHIKEINRVRKTKLSKKNYFACSIVPPAMVFWLICFGFPWIKIVPPALTLASTKSVA